MGSLFFGWVECQDVGNLEPTTVQVLSRVGELIVEGLRPALDAIIGTHLHINLGRFCKTSDIQIGFGQTSLAMLLSEF